VFFVSRNGKTPIFPFKDHYIRQIIELPDFPIDEFDTESPGIPAGKEATKSLRAIVCMSPAGSHRLKQSQYLQSDIAFQRVEGFYEFEIAAMDSYANTSMSVSVLPLLLAVAKV
jgi:hypothetical protein